ncbi:unnamed protein product, partial [Lampetra planeri]
FFTGLSSSDELKVATIGLPLISSGIRIRPVNWQNDIAIRMEILTFCTKAGFAAVTLFQLSCSGWKSESRQQLTYSFKAVSNHTEFLIYNSQLSQTPSLLLPVGDLDTQGTLDLRASVCNSVRACTSARIQVKARSFDGIYQTLLTLGTLQNKKAVAVNPFAWNRDNSINSSVASLQVSDVKRSINATSALVKVKNLAIAEQVTTFTATSAGDISVDKRFMVKSNGSAVLLDILQADNVVGGLELLIRYQQAPQLEPLVFDYRFVWESNNSAGSDQQSPISNDTERKNNTANGQRRQHSFFIPGNETQPGVYYITLKSKGKTCHL